MNGWTSWPILRILLTRRGLATSSPPPPPFPLARTHQWVQTHHRTRYAVLNCFTLWGNNWASPLWHKAVVSGSRLGVKHWGAAWLRSRSIYEGEKRGQPRSSAVAKHLDLEAISNSTHADNATSLILLATLEIAGTRPAGFSGRKSLDSIFAKVARHRHAQTIRDLVEHLTGEAGHLCCLVQCVPASGHPCRCR